MPIDTGHKKTIARNTAFLYVRMLVVMAVTFYTSRVVLNALGETDYGIYDVVGGVVTLLSFVNGSLSASTSRFLTYELGRGDTCRLASTFSAALNLHIGAALLVIVLGETLGVWFLYNKMTIPPEQLTAAFWILQFSIVTTCFTFTQVPFNASIISHENMSVFAYVGLYEGFSKLAIAYLIQLGTDNRLILYGLLLMVNAVLIQTFLRFYTRRRYDECRMRMVRDKALYRKLLGYSGWDIFGNVAVMVQSQGINIVLNIFYGPVLNAARAIAVQIQGGLRAFVTNFLMAVRPRVVKLFAEGDHAGMYNLTFYGCKIAYFMILALVLPIAFDLEFLLHVWLGDNVPPYTDVFAWIIMGIVLSDAFHSAFLMAFHAIGRIKTGNVVCGSLMIMALPVGYLTLKVGLPPYSVFVTILVINVICHIISWIIAHGYVRFSYRRLLGIVYGPCMLTSVLALAVPSLIVWAMPSGWMRFITLLTIGEGAYLALVYLVGFNRDERAHMINPLIGKLIKKFKR
ncbi:MAG: hypothetical protein Q4C34_04600 [Bacteroidales bacterium]|nr:hypothetical protein [Bacteroidales bacterium]